MTMASSPPHLLVALGIFFTTWSSLPSVATSFVHLAPQHRPFSFSPSPLRSSAEDSPSDSPDSFVVESREKDPAARIADVKEELIRKCERHRGDGGDDDGYAISRLANELEDLGEKLGFGQGSSSSGMLSGEWELIYASEDETRSSPFFWAFRKAFPDKADQIFGITDSIPSPLKDIGPATQSIQYEDGKGTGTLVSRVEVATLNKVATSVMTTRCTILAPDGLDAIRVLVETTKPEKSTILEKLGPLGEFLEENAPPFPSGEALERVKPGSSEVTIQTKYCDESLRISRDVEGLEDFFVWTRKGFFGDFEV